MARELMIVKGNMYYLVDLSADKGYSFTEYGQSIEAVNARYAVSLGGAVTDIDILSILSDGTMNTSELYLGGQSLRVPKTGMSVFSKISKALPRVSFVTFRVVRPEMMGLVQILVPLKKWQCTMEMVEHLLKV